MHRRARHHLGYAALVAVAVGCAYAPATDLTSEPASAKTFCDAFVASAKKCSQAGDADSCLTSAERYSDDELSAATACTDKPCAEVDACVDAALGRLAMPDGASDASTDGSKRDADGSPSKKDAGKDAAPTLECEGFGKSTTCRECQEERCCTEMAACRGSVACEAFLDCCASSGCPNGDLTCLNSKCKFPFDADDAIFAFNTWVDCRANKCTSECPGKPYW